MLLFSLLLCAGAEHLRLCSAEPWCAVPSSGLQLGPAPTLVDPTVDEEQACSAVSLAISLLSGTAAFSSSSHCSTAPTNQPSTSSTVVRTSRTSNPTNSTYYSFEQLAEPYAAVHADMLSPAPPPARPFAASERILGWSAVGSNPVVKRLRLTSTSTAVESSCRTDSPDACMENAPPSPPRAAILQAVCPGAPKRPRPAFLLVPLAELGRIETVS